MDTLVDVAWLSEHLDDPDLVVLDCSVYQQTGEHGRLLNVCGRAEYDEGHIATAGFADLLGDLADPESPLEAALPTPERFCAAMGALGVGDDSSVVLYDGNMSVWAARVWWMLRWVGFDRAAILDGGLVAWLLADRPLSIEPSTQPSRRLTPRPRPELIADRDEVLAAIEDDAVWLVDTMPPEHYRGEWTLYDRPGHIPGATNVSVLEMFEDTGRYRSLDELASLFADDRRRRTITYCGGGIAASATAFAMTRLGFTDVAVYTASLEEWAADARLPLVLGAP